MDSLDNILLYDNNHINIYHHKKMRVAAYCRVSKRSDSQESSIQTQIESYKKIINKNDNWELVDIYVDKGITGTSINKRLGFMKMIDDARDGKIDMIIAKSISRFARNTLDMLEYTRLLKKYNVGVYFEKERINTISDTSEMLLTVYAAFAQEESHSISLNIRRGFIQHFKMGIPKYSKTYGYDNNWKIIDKEAIIIKKIYDLYLHGFSIASIATILNNDNIPSPWKSCWYKTTISSILKNEKYIGDVCMQKSVVTDLLNHVEKKNNNLVPTYYKENHHKAIIDKNDYQLVSKMFLLKDKSNGSCQYPYYGYLHCPYCGNIMVQYMSNLPSNPKSFICINKCNDAFILVKYINQSIKEAFINHNYLLDNGKIELYHLSKYIKDIEIINDYKDIKISFNDNDVYIYHLRYEEPSHIPNPLIEYINDDIYINNKRYTKKQGSIIAKAINNIKDYNHNLNIIDDNGIYRVINKDSSWNRIYANKDNKS